MSREFGESIVEYIVGDVEIIGGGRGCCATEKY